MSPEQWIAKFITTMRQNEHEGLKPCHKPRRACGPWIENNFFNSGSLVASQTAYLPPWSLLGWSSLIDSVNNCNPISVHSRNQFCNETPTAAKVVLEKQVKVVGSALQTMGVKSFTWPQTTNKWRTAATRSYLHFWKDKTNLISVFKMLFAVVLTTSSCFFNMLQLFTSHKVSSSPPSCFWVI